MAQKNYKVDEAIEIGYQAPNKQTGQEVIAEIYLPNKEKDSNYPDITLAEIGDTGTYRGTFTPDAVGEWQVIIHLSDGDGQVIKGYSVGEYDVKDAVESTAVVDGKVEAIDGKVDTTNTKLDTVDGKADTTHTKLDAADTKLDDINNKVSALDTPPMAF